VIVFEVTGLSKNLMNLVNKIYLSTLSQSYNSFLRSRFLL
jgi:hypothetical protein